MAPRKKGRTHGINATYSKGCRCAPCREAGSRYAYRRRHGRDKPEPDATPTLVDPFPSLTPEQRDRLAARGIDPRRSLVRFLASIAPSWTCRQLEQEARLVPPGTTPGVQPGESAETRCKAA